MLPHCGTIAASTRPRPIMPSFDTVSELNSHEVANAVDQANRELGQRFDFKDTGAVFELEESTVKMRAEVDFQLKQMLEILKLRLAKRRSEERRVGKECRSRW